MVVVAVFVVGPFEFNSENMLQRAHALTHTR